MTHKQSILDEFDEKFYEGDSNAIHCSKHKYYATPTEIKAFISRALDSQMTSLREKVEAQFIAINNKDSVVLVELKETHNDAISEILALINQDN